MVSRGATAARPLPAAQEGIMEAHDQTGDTLALLTDKAKELGADAAVVISADDVVVDERVRLKCAVPVCEGYGQYLHCPPNIMSVQEFRTVLARYSTAMVVQVVSGSSSADLDGEGLADKRISELEELYHGDANRMLGKVVTRLEAEAFKAGFPYATGFSGGLCLLCPSCVGVSSGEPCRHPYEARPSMEGVGIDVYKTAERAGLKMAFSSDEPVRWTGLILLD